MQVEGKASSIEILRIVKEKKGKTGKNLYLRKKGFDKGIFLKLTYFMLYCIDVEHYKESGMMVTGLQYKVGVESPICTDLLADIATDKYSDCVIVNNWVIYKNLGFANQYNLNKQYFSKRMFKIMGNVRDAFNNFVMYGCQRDYFDTLLKAYKLAKEGNGIEGFIERKHYNMALNFSKEQMEEIEETERDNVLLKQIFNVG